MANLKFRSYQKELLDAEVIPFDDIRQNMRELNTINTLLGGHQITLAGIKAFIKENKTGNPITICEIGCGGGDNLKAIDTWGNTKNISIRFIGIDIKKECIEFAKKQYPSLDAQWITSEYTKADMVSLKPDIIFSSLFCHHFTEIELAGMVLWMRQNSRLGFFINDLQRHPLAYYSIKFITRFFSKSYLVKNDAPLSVARGFKRNEWEAIFQSANVINYRINWKWAFRYLIVSKHAG